MERASADVGLMLVAYNLRRIFNIVGWQALLAYARAGAASLPVLWVLITKPGIQCVTLARE